MFLPKKKPQFFSKYEKDFWQKHYLISSELQNEQEQCQMASLGARKTHTGFSRTQNQVNLNSFFQFQNIVSVYVEKEFCSFSFFEKVKEKLFKILEEPKVMMTYQFVGPQGTGSFAMVNFKIAATLFIYKKFVLNVMFQRNASKFSIFYV